MSLINDALKKAQKQRTGESPTLGSMPGIGGQSAQQISRRTRSDETNTLLVKAGIAAGVALVIAIGAFVLLREKPPISPVPVADNLPAKSVSTNAGSPVVVAPPSAPQVAQQPTTNNQQPAASMPPPFTLKTDPAAPKTEPAPPVVAKTEPTPPAVKRPDGSSVALAKDGQPTTNNRQPAQVSAPAGPAPKLEPRAIQFIESLKVAGIRASATDAKVLMNDRVYRIGSLVEPEMGLKLVEIANGALTFEDERGARYTRTF